VAGYLCVCVFGFGFVARLSSIGNRQEGRFLERFARDRERARVMVFCVAEMGEENK
jgi:hypothetical protein